ncbi:MAG: DNA-3-methyladenine glycosylase family protein [Spirosomataceae bacterium]
MTPQPLKNDPILNEIIEKTPQYKKAFEFGGDVYLALMESIVSQQISVKAADSIFERFLNLFADEYPNAKQMLEMTDDELRSAGLSFQKIKYMRNVAEFSLANDISYENLNKYSDDEIVELLTQIKGVGRWTVEMLLIFVLDRPDVFPIDDLVVRQKLIKAYGLDDTQPKKELYRQIHEIANTWRPHRSLASKYLWRWKPEY